MISTLIATIIAGAVLAQQPLELLELEPLQPSPQSAQPMTPMQPIEVTPSPMQPASPPSPSRAGSAYTAGMSVKVLATSLAFRTGPGTEAPLIHYIPAGETLRVLLDNSAPVEEIIGGTPGWWLLVEHFGRPGYVFDAYLTQVEGAQLAPPPMAPLDPDSPTAPIAAASPQAPLDSTCVPGTRVGPITHYTNYSALAAAFGAENLSEGEVDFGGGVSERVTQVFAGTDKELLIRWEVYQQTPLSVRVLGPAWKTPKGIGVGMPATTLETLNGRYFAFYGFGWEFAGQITGWEGGSLETDHTLRDKISLALAPVQPYSAEDFELLRGKVEFTSDHPMVPRANLCVESMMITLNP